MGIEPTYKGFADLSLTTWVPRLESTVYRKLSTDSARILLAAVSRATRAALVAKFQTAGHLAITGCATRTECAPARVP